MTDPLHLPVHAQSRNELLQTVYDNMNDIHTRLRKHFERVMSEVVLSPSQIHVLFIVSDLQPVNSKRLATTLRLTPGAISQLVDILQEGAYIDRASSATDRRVSYISLTPKGKSLVTKCQKARNELLTEAMAELSDEELEQQAAIQIKIMQHMDKEER